MRNLFSTLARGFGGHGFRSTKPGELHAQINEALRVDGPAIVDRVVAANEGPNFPHLELDEIGNYALAKIREALRAVNASEWPTFLIFVCRSSCALVR